MIQARTGSTRFPKKVLAKVEGKPLIWHVINRVKKVHIADQIILITSTSKEDQALLKIARHSKIMSFTGDEFDVLKRHYDCALQYDADPIIRITGDCPLIDPKLIEKILRFYLTHNYNYVSNTIKPTFPDGLDVEIFSFSTLNTINHNAKLKAEREHVTSYIRNNRSKFKIHNYEYNNDLSNYRWTVDQKEDLRFVRRIYSIMRPSLVFSMEKILNVLEKKPELLEINKGIRRNAGYYISVKKEKIVKNNNKH